MLPIQYLTIHCAATPEGRAVTAASIEQWDIQKFGQKSYHWIVLLDGTKHRSLNDDRRGAHVGGKNTGNIGICYVGGMDAQMKAPEDTRTDAQKQALRELVDEYRAKYPILREPGRVRGHRDWPGVNKACPSFSVADWLREAGVPEQAPATTGKNAVVRPTLRKGDRGDAVRRLQRSLAALMPSVVVDGVFGPATEAAVINFQNGHGLARDGIVGPATWGKLG